jgi:sulfate adenylyltransferase large subunit
VGIQELLQENEKKDLLRIVTTGSVDDGKSTLIGRLLYDSKSVYEDHLASLERDSRRMGSAEVDYSLLLDGLQAEREQGITIDVAYRYLSTPLRSFIIADTPGHVQYTSNMATGASTASLAILLVDARHGVVDQTRRHAFIASLLGIKHFLVAVNKMDLVDFAQKVFESIRREFVDFAARLEVRDVHFIPISALKGDNVVEQSERTPWFEGVSLLHHLETVHIASDRNLIDLRFPVQSVLRQSDGFRGYSGTVSSGVVRKGDEILVLPSETRTTVERIVTFDGDLEAAFPPMAVTVTLSDEVDVSRGDYLVHPNNIPRKSRDLEAMLVWLSPEPMKLYSQYLIKHGNSTVQGEVADIRYRTNVNSLRREEATDLTLNEIGRVHLVSNKPLFFDAYGRNRAMGSFVLIDPIRNGTVAAGMLLARHAVDEERSEGEMEEVEDSSCISLEERWERLGQRSATLWLTGPNPESRKLLAFALEKRLFDLGYFPQVLHRANLGVPENSSFRDRSEHVRRAISMAALACRLGWISIVDLTSPLAGDRSKAREFLGDSVFREVLVPGEMGQNQGGYEAPEAPALTLRGGEEFLEAGIEKLLRLLLDMGVISRVCNRKSE